MDDEIDVIFDDNSTNHILLETYGEHDPVRALMMKVAILMINGDFDQPRLSSTLDHSFTHCFSVSFGLKNNYYSHGYDLHP